MRSIYSTHIEPSYSFLLINSQFDLDFFFVFLLVGLASVAPDSVLCSAALRAHAQKSKSFSHGERERERERETATTLHSTHHPPDDHRTRRPLIRARPDMVQTLCVVKLDCTRGKHTLPSILSKIDP